MAGVKDWLEGVAEESDDPEYVSIAQGFLDRLEKLYPDKEPSLSYYVAECMEYPVLGEYHETQTLKEAAALYEKIPADRMNGGKGIGFNLDDGSDYAGSYPLVQGGRVTSEMIDLVEHYKNSPLVQQAVAEAKQYFPDVRETEYQPKESHKIETAVEQKKADPSIAHSTTEIKAPEKASEPAQKASTEHHNAGKKESVLKALHERQAQIKEKEKQTPAKQHDRKKGEQSL